MSNWVKSFTDANPGVIIAKRARHALHTKVGKDFIAHVTGAPCHFFDNNGVWQSIDTALVYDSLTDTYGAAGIPVRLKADGTVTTGGYSQRTLRVGVLDNAAKTFTAIRALPAGLPLGDQLIRETGFYRHVLTLKENGLREELVLLQKPPLSVLDDWLVLETAIGGLTLADGWVDEWNTEGMYFTLPSVVDANGDIARAKRFFRNGRLYTGIQGSWLDKAAYPVTIDPDFAGDTADGLVLGASTVYATAQSTATSSATTSQSNSMGQNYSNPTYTCYRIFLKFDTSSIGAGSTITQVNLKLVCTLDGSDTDFDVQIVKQDWSAQDPIVSGNREAAYDNCLSGTADDNIWRNTNGMSTNTQYASGNLNTAWPSKTGNTYYSLRSNRDLAATTPTGSENINIALANHTTEAYRPVLTVAYTAGGGAKTPYNPFRQMNPLVAM